jgi:hypothetical protein
VRHPKKKTDARIDNNPPHQSKKTKKAKNNDPDKIVVYGKQVVRRDNF